MSDYDEELEPNDWVKVKNPIKHRKIARENSIKWRKENPITHIFQFDMLLDTGIADDMWLCDFCNNLIPVYVGDTKELSTITIWNNSRALCDSCLKDFKEKWSTKEDETYDCECGCSKTEEE